MHFNAIIASPPPPQPSDPCYPSPCGPNARCRSENGVAACECLPEYQGNPYEGCRPECLISSDCIMSKACIKNKCQDPCPGTCGLSAICSVSNHIPICYCPEGTTGDPFRDCQLIPESKGNFEFLHHPHLFTVLYAKAKSYGQRKFYLVLSIQFNLECVI